MAEDTPTHVHAYPAGVTWQFTAISLYYDFLSVLGNMDKVATRAAEKGINFKLREGFSAETSGKN